MRERLDQLRETLDVWLVSADTQGTLDELAVALGVQARRLHAGDEAMQKATLVQELGAEQTAAIGNGANDVIMLQQAALGITVPGSEGLATACIAAADIITPNIEAALDLLLYPRRLIATLRA